MDKSRLFLTKLWHLSISKKSFRPLVPLLLEYQGETSQNDRATTACVAFNIYPMGYLSLPLGIIHELKHEKNDKRSDFFLKRKSYVMIKIWLQGGLSTPGPLVKYMCKIIRE